MKMILADSANAVDGTVWWQLTLDQDLLDTLRGSFPNWFQEPTTNTTASVTATTDPSISSGSTISHSSNCCNRKRRLSDNSRTNSENTSTNSDSDCENDRCHIILNNNNEKCNHCNKNKSYHNNQKRRRIDTSCGGRNTYNALCLSPRNRKRRGLLTVPSVVCVSSSSQFTAETAFVSSIHTNCLISSGPMITSQETLQTRPTATLKALSSDQHSTASSLACETLLQPNLTNYVYKPINLSQQDIQALHQKHQLTQNRKEKVKHVFYIIIVFKFLNILY